jgi:beta-glucosidase
MISRILAAATTSTLLTGACLAMTPEKTKHADVDARARALIAQMTREEKAAQLVGFGDSANPFGNKDANTFGTVGLERLGIPPMIMGHAITGVRSGRASHISGTYFCTPVGVACAWDVELYEKIGAASGLELLALGQDLNLGPTLNIVRHPLGGRNWETFSEDPFLTARLIAPYAKAQQEKGMICGPKHYVVNEQEHQRFDINNEVDERTLREIYLPPFQAAVEEGGALNIMSAYTRVNGVFMSEHRWLLHDILRGEWGFEGFVLSDFAYAVRSTVGSVKAGMNIEMNAPTHYGPKMLEALERGEITDAEVDQLLLEKLRVMILMGMLDGRPRPPKSIVHATEHQALALDLARRAPVLLKNEGNLLPLSRNTLRKLAVLGPNATRPSTLNGVYRRPDSYANYLQGGGSGNSPYIKQALIDPLAGLKQTSGPGVTLTTAPGCEPAGRKSDGIEDDKPLIAEAAKLAAAADAAVLFVGLTGQAESEGFDRTDARLPAEQEALIHAVLDAQPRTIVVVIAGSYIDMSAWIGRAPTVLFAPYAGEKIGLGLAELLWGDANPSGRLPFSWPHSVDAYPKGTLYTGGPYSETKRSNVYSEGVFVGYRYFDTHGTDLLFPFGHGLSYTAFKYGPIKVDRPASGVDEPVTASIEIENTGSRAGAEVVQLYVHDPKSSEPRPRRELKGFQRVALKPGERQTVTFKLGPDAFRYFRMADKRWVVEPGAFVLEAGASSRDIRASLELTKR